MNPLIQQITVPNPRPGYADVHITLHQWPGHESPYIYQVMVIDNTGYCRADERFTSLTEAREEFAAQLQTVESEFAQQEAK